MQNSSRHDSHESIDSLMTVQARNQGGARGAKAPLEKFSTPLEKFIGHRLKLLDIVQKIWAPLRKVFVPPSDPSWLRACECVILVTIISLL